MIVSEPAIDGDQPRRQRRARLMLSVALLGLGAWTLQGFLGALVWAAILAVAIWPAYQRAVHRWPPGRHNVVLPLVFSAVIAIVFLLPFVLLGIQAGREAHDVLAFGSDAMKNGIPVPDMVGRLPGVGHAVGQWWGDNLAQPSGLSELLRRLSHNLFETHSRSFGLALIHKVVTFGFTILALFFVLQNADALIADMLRASEKVFGPAGERIGRQIVSSIHGTVDGLVLVGLGEGVLLGIAFVVAGVPHPTLLGALAAVAAMIPYVIVLVLAATGLILVGQGAVGAAVAVLAFGLVVNFVADHFVRPGLIGGATKLPFLWVLLGVLGGVEIWGLIGLFVGPALMAALILLWRELVRPEPVLDEKPVRTTKTLSPVPIAGE